MMSSAPIDACKMQIPHTDQVCAWLMQHAGLKIADLERAQRLSTEPGDLLGLLTRLGLVSEVELARAWADLLDAPLLLADAAPPLLDPLPVLTERFMRHYQVVPMGWHQGGLRVMASNPAQWYPFQALAYACEVPVWLAVGSRNEVDTLIERYYGQGRSAMGSLIENLDEQGGVLEDIEHLKDMASEAPVIRLVNLILQRAVEQRASDIHIEPFENQLKVRYRIDGVLHDAEAPPASSSAAVISRVKIMARLDIAERRLPQDGRIMLRIQGKALDLRVSTVPTSFGESVVMRLLDRQTVQFDFPSLGFDGPRLAAFQDLLARPHGILLVTGPTGSGKTTTLYTALSQLNTAERKIITVEDPVEYQLEGINQIQVKPAIGLDFAGALRAIVRQDPDVIMIGEIRDLETCRIAVQSSLTGHLVLSTLHTNSAAASITRLLDMGVESYLIASTVSGILAQRLVRRLDPATRVAFQAPAELIKEHGLDRLTEQRPILLYRGDYHGRSALTELLVMNDELRGLLMGHADAASLEHAARRAGLRTLYEDGLRQALAGVTSLEEVLRVTRGDDA
ncbi:type II secretion system protein GspE [Pseudomonas sp. MPR-AND1B]|nr:type II secretion system protein GspE [Pseudomonas sp. MPR-R3A]PMY98905.1 type II secretion system protein GspE [Pseudomonas sp. FW305-124]PMZ68662.1 type II secretion system protein GspE [Pseudomonas sp. GW247-3R2A]PNA94213.1 type II secretion system protein GspE [Pseudomonas sp. FW300-E2]PNB03028.1 type II secretion system protein GspE [Pseudomonas sp. MPR-AND1B]VVO47474.1 Type II secretion system protein E [Pseudomonas fluorescens]